MVCKVAGSFVTDCDNNRAIGSVVNSDGACTLVVTSKEPDGAVASKLMLLEFSKNLKPPTSSRVNPV